MAKEQPPIKEVPIQKNKCPRKHSRAYKTSFNGLYCPDCNHNLEENK